MQLYEEYLADFGFQAEPNGIWLKVGEVEGVQGWKLHVSTIQPDVLLLLSKIVPELKDSAVAFKIARDEFVLAQLNEGEFGQSQIGKFMTIYPADEHRAFELAEKLCHFTKGMRGPFIPSDLKLGDVVYARYGSYNPIIMRDVLGQQMAYIYDGKEDLIPDAREIPFKTPDDVDNPFESLINNDEKNHGSKNNGNGKLFGPGYLVVDIIKANAKGNIYQAIDVREQKNVALIVLKQGHKYCMSDKEGRDICDRLKQQFDILKELQNKLNVPKAFDYFEVNGDGYLPIEFIEGQSIETLTYSVLNNRKWETIAKKQQLRLLGLLERLLTEVIKLQEAGFIHRDITASNVWIDQKDHVYLLDLELTYKKGGQYPLFFNGTPGFMSPNQLGKNAPEPEDDIYAIGCIMLLVFTGIDPRRLIHREISLNRDRLQALVKGLPEELVKIIVTCIDDDPAARPDLAIIKKRIEEYIISIDPVTGTGKINRKSRIDKIGKTPDEEIKRILRKGVNTILHHLPAEQEKGLWLSPKMNGGSGQSANVLSFELRKSAHRGVAGVLYLLSKIQKSVPGDLGLKKRMQEIAEWLVSGIDVVDAEMPGLYFGDMGISVVLVEGIESGLVNETPEIISFISVAVNRETSWHDITHGAAGMGMGCLRLLGFLKQRNIDSSIHGYAEMLIDQQNIDGSWTVPEGVDGMSGQVITGFAHGVAGIVYFLAEYGNIYNSIAAKQASVKGADWLMISGIENQKANIIEWKYSDKQEEVWKWWCHGGPGISLSFLKLYELTQDKKYADIAIRALNVHPDHLVYTNLSQCHGLSGLGEIYLEAFRVLKDKRFLKKALLLLGTIHNLRFENEEKLFWLVEDVNNATADLMMGMGGVLHFYLSILLKNEKSRFPLL